MKNKLNKQQILGTGSGEMNENNFVPELHEIQNALFHLLSMGELLIIHHDDLCNRDLLKHVPGEQHEPILSIADIIQEKAKMCLEKLEALEERCLEQGA
jgi:hypothetical protein